MAGIERGRYQPPQNKEAAFNAGPPGGIGGGGIAPPGWEEQPQPRDRSIRLVSPGERINIVEQGELGGAHFRTLPRKVPDFGDVALFGERGLGELLGGIFGVAIRKTGLTIGDPDNMREQEEDLYSLEVELSPGVPKRRKGPVLVCEMSIDGFDTAYRAVLYPMDEDNKTSPSVTGFWISNDSTDERSYAILAPANTEDLSRLSFSFLFANAD